MDDALAMDNFKTLKESDSADDLTLQAADNIEDQASQAAPGSAPFLTATAVAASIESQALTQKMLAAELRQEAARLAHENALRKRGASITGRRKFTDSESSAEALREGMAMKRVMQGARRCFAWAWRHKVRTVALVVVLVLIAPKPVKSQFIDPCCAIMAAGLNTIGSTLSSVIGGGLNDIQSIEQDISKFEQTAVWPQNLINQARSLVASMQGIFTQMEGVMRIPVNSATLSATQQFEQNLLSSDPNQIAQTGHPVSGCLWSRPGRDCGLPSGAGHGGHDRRRSAGRDEKSD